MKEERNAAGDIFMELEEIQKMDITPSESGPYSITVDFGGFLSIICC